MASAQISSPVGPLSTGIPVGSELVRRALALVDAGTTDMAEDVLRVPLGYYRDPELFARERALCLSTPLALVPSAQVARPHDFVVREVMGTSVLVSRDDAGDARVFLNYCRHRGGKPAQGCGSARRFTCPYHAWSYDSAGRLVGMPGQAGFDGLDREAYGLLALPCEERHGLVWAVLTAGAPIDVAAHLGPLDSELGAWNLGGSGYLTEREISAEVNWKAAIEAFAENYHFPYVHANSIVGQNTVADTAVYDGYGAHHRLGFPCPWIEGARDDPVLSSPLNYMVFIYWIFPNLTLAMSPIGTEIIDILPGDHAGRCVLRHGWMSTEPATDDATRAGYFALYEAVHAAVRDEDFGVLPGCGQAARRGQHGHMVIGRNEIGVQHVVATFSEVLGINL
ncbi:MAG TPA: aromatic ring-hydroxylating dioxygenase subunit alpha [Acidimicrobiales bacterium]|nr:aromatic ring-hydroxylating dioxygenase subunit alpha [Acidimicrobiales bacterium]